jgi:hypothetical protein
MRQKIREWLKRYIPAEIAAIIMGISFSLLTYAITNNRIATAYAGSISDSIGYYSVISLRDIAESKKHHKKKNKKYGYSSFMKNIRNIVLEFGFSEFFDSLVIRPFMMYIFPLLLGNMIFGVLAGKIIADIIFYIPTIIAYELRKKHMKD